MNNIDPKIASDNILKLLHNSGISDEEFANLIEISIRWFKYIKSGQYFFKDSEIKIACELFGQKVKHIGDRLFEADNDLRDYLIKIHRNNDRYSAIVNKDPTIPYAIEFKLLNDPDFQKRKLEVKEINKIFNKYGWDFKSSSLSNALKKMSKYIKHETSPDKKGTHLYSKR